jgi:RND family efflux transporter MFP subunit
MRTRQPRSAAQVLPLIVLLGVWSVTRAASPQGDASPVTLAEVKREPLQEQVKLTGSAIPWRKTLLSPRVDGLVTEVKVDEGSWVQPGDEILVLDDRLATLEVRSAEARVAEARARQRDATRIRDELLRLKEGRHTAQSAIDSAIADVESRSAALNRERAELARYEELAARHRVPAPFAGMVVAKRVEAGQWVQRSDPVIELVSVDTLRIRAPLPQRYYPRLRSDAPALVRFDALPGQAFEGRVLARLALGSDATRSFPLLIDIPNPEHRLAPGMSARVWVQLDDGRSEALTVPRDAVVDRADGRRVVWRVRPDEGVPKAYAVTVETGRALGDRLELVDGDLAAGDRVVLLGNENLRQGQTVAPQDPPGATD